MWEHIPPELKAEILSRLPVKSLLRLRCVSKLFRSTINSGNFAKLHIAHSLKNNTNLSLLITEKCCFGGKKIMSIEFNDYSIGKHIVPLVHIPEEDDISAKPIGFCNGLICLSIYFMESQDSVIAVANMATGIYRILPHLGHDEELNDEDFRRGVPQYVFGYDPSGDDYKVVRITHLYNELGAAVGCLFVVYSLNENSWRKGSTYLPYSIVYDPSCMNILTPSVSGNIHFIVSPLRGEMEVNMIACFDLSMENISMILPLPDALLYSDIYMTVLGGCLCIMSFCDGGEDIWVMKEYGVKESWTKLFTLSSMEYLWSRVPVAYSKDGDKVLMTIHEGRVKLAWYDPKTKKMKIVRKFKRALPRDFYADVMVESLVSLDDVGQ